MSESEVHRTLKLVGMAFLHNMGCKPIATEVSIRRYMPTGFKWTDSRSVIDVIGVSRNPILEEQQWSSGGTWQRTMGYKNVLRGIEVKISRGDFKNGFVKTGCNYIYVLTPLGVIDKSEIPKNVGFLEYNIDEHDMFLGEDFSFCSSALNITKKPRNVPTEIKMDRVTDRIWERSKSVLVKLVADILLNTQDFAFSVRHVVTSYSYNSPAGIHWSAYLKQPRSRISGRGETKIDAMIDLFTKIKEGDNKWE